MDFLSSSHQDLYKAAYKQFMSDARFYAGQVQDYLIHMSDSERLLALCGFILIVMYVILSRARKKYNPGSHGRQFVAAFILVSIVAFGTGWTINAGKGSYSHIFEL